ncbi:hypothetical protein MBLNU13_g02994t1 [Cladosporium sp. NU13]
MNSFINTLRTPLSGDTQPPHNGGNQWRCPHKRLHLDNQDCIPVSPDSPILDTPSKYRKIQARRNEALLVNSQATTQPTPSGPPVGSQHIAPKGSLASVANSPQDDGTNHGQEQSQNAHDSQNFLVPSSPPSNHALERVPETPLADPPSSPPLPLLTAENLRQLNSQPTHKSARGAGAPSSSGHAELPASSAPAPSVRSLPSEVAHRISRLVLRTRINALNQDASEVQLEATRGALEAALARIKHQASRVDAWMRTAIALLLLCLAYAAWRQWNSAEFALIEECRRKWFGL